MYCLEEALNYLNAKSSGRLLSSDVRHLAEKLISCVDLAGEHDIHFRRVIIMYLIRSFLDLGIDLTQLVLKTIEDKIKDKAEKLPHLPSILKSPVEIVYTHKYRLSDIIDSLLDFTKKNPDNELSKKLKLGTLGISEIRARIVEFIADLVANMLVSAHSVLTARSTARGLPIRDMLGLLIPALRSGRGRGGRGTVRRR